MNQIICDACGSVIKNEPRQQYSVWGMTTDITSGGISVTQDNLDICEACWNKIAMKGKNNA